ncbi:MAG: ATP-binding protein [Desulfobacterales bacterium]|nr:ATP-binding protein [Desulfobacterales bacterium]
MTNQKQEKKIPYPEISREDFVGRNKEIKIIDDAISDKGQLRIVNIHGIGGIGKTSILREIQKRYSGKEDLLVTQLVDFFDIAASTSRGFLEKITSEIAPEHNDIFETYRDDRDRADEIVFAGITGKTLEDATHDVFKSFINCFNSITATVRIVLLVDTFELAQFLLGEWLLGWLKELKNTVVIIAGRENKTWNGNLTANIGKQAVDYIELGAFEIKETKELFELTEARKGISEEELRKLQLLSDGRPILLILAIDRKWPKGLVGQKCPVKERTATSEKYTLDQLGAMDSDELKPIRKEFNEELVNGALQLLNAHPKAIAIFYMAQVFKFFTTDMLAYLLDITTDEAQSTMDEIRDWAFVKYDHRTGSYLLHDLVRELVMSHAWPKIDQRGIERKRISGETVKYYDILINKIEEQEEQGQKKRKRAKQAGKKEEETAVLAELNNLKRLRQHYKAQQVYYNLIADQRLGVLRYQSVYVYNLWVRDMEANRFLELEREQALISVKIRYPEHEDNLDNAKYKIVIEHKFNEGLAILETLLNRKCEDDIDLFSRSNIFLYQGIAYNFKGEYELAEKKLKKAVEGLEGLENKVKDPENPNNLFTRFFARSMARTYGHLGLGYMQAGRLSDAIAAYRKALPYSQMGNIKSELTYQLNDLAYAHARLGEYERGRDFWEKGLELRENLLFYYPIGLSYNVRGMIEYLADKPRDGLPYCEKALSIFNNIGVRRGVGLASRALGAILARIAEVDSSSDRFEEAEKHLLEAVKIFGEGGEVPEPTYLAESYERLGILYNSWRKLLSVQSAAKEEISKKLQNSKHSFQRCIEEYTKEGSELHQMTAIGRLCRVYIEVEELEKAQNELDKMKRILLGELKKFLSQPGWESRISLNELKNKRRELIYPIGKFEHRQASLAFQNYQKKKDSNMLKEAARHYAFADVYLETYSKEAFATKNMLKEVSNFVKQIHPKEVYVFKEQVKASLRENNLEDYSEIIEKIEDAELLGDRE